jgi:hypothetical protein
MATRLIGTDSVDPWLPDVVKAHAVQSKVDDVAGNFNAGDVEAVLAELADQIDDVVISGGSMPGASDAETIAGTLTGIPGRRLPVGVDRDRASVVHVSDVRAAHLRRARPLGHLDRSGGDRLANRVR